MVYSLCVLKGGLLKMNFSIERPWVLYALLLLIPVALFEVRSGLKTYKALKESYVKVNNPQSQKKLKFLHLRFFSRGILRALFWIMLVLAASGISWGTVSTPVQKTGHAVSLVFDISYSMTCHDAPSGLSRLEASTEYAKILLSKIPCADVSCVIAKGGGVVAIPLTSDTESIYSFLEMLSPNMMTTPGTSLGKGIDAAVRSFPSNMSHSSVIWLFTDGDETDSLLLPSINSALQNGINIVVIGFGSERGGEVYAGDKTSLVKTSLKADHLKEVVENANKKNSTWQGLKFSKTASAKYVDATDVGSAISVLSSVHKFSNTQSALGQNTKGNSVEARDVLQNETTVSYKMQPVSRHQTFIALAILFFVLSFIVSEFSPSNVKQVMALSLICALFTSCSSRFENSKNILMASWAWHQENYDEAVADFLEVATLAEQNHDELIKQYALYGLSSTYLMQNEKDASFERMSQISYDAPPKIRFGVFYNSGILAQREGNYSKAVELFKEALLVEPSNVNAKINLELSLSQSVQNAKEGEQEITPTSETQNNDTEIEQAIFNHIKEKDMMQWKSKKSDEITSALDY